MHFFMHRGHGSHTTSHDHHSHHDEGGAS
jgi:hypothetical protein